MIGQAYCSRCKRDFSSQQLLQQHYNDSASYGRCEVCGFDGSTWEKFLEHHRTTTSSCLPGLRQWRGNDMGSWVAGVSRSSERAKCLQNMPDALRKH